MSRQILFGPHHDWPTFGPVNDTVRGGASTSQWKVLDESNRARFSGHLDISALGGAGFASQSTAFKPTLSLSPHDFSGLAITLSVPSHIPQGHPSAFVLTLKNDIPGRRQDGRRESVLSYEMAFDLRELAGEKDREVEIVAEWKDFKATYRGREDKEAKPLNSEKIEELSFMCRSNFGAQHGDFSLDIVSLAAVREPFPSHQGSSAPSQTWFGWLLSLITNAWSSLCSKLRGDGALRLPE
ncbi:complex I intermediate-associated protein 30-domain-containing protein [Leucosporidium creatinivorum]|uniref:Complex I intermediate-associated protein 30-domain-containing protein n=1 Tax=Leucosporidium creatinivorum TaxID=106004 RepID=A0A1Y2DDP5_9BASI|nr:complex I intermediate-associated protein 30-domain-containing protein [Leucosporidium creatinivorum]